MEIRGKIEQIIWAYAFSLVLMVSCNQVSQPEYKLQNVFLQPINSPIEPDNATFYVTVNNLTDKDLYLNWNNEAPFNSTLLRGGNREPGFFLFSNLLFSGALKLRISNGSKI